MTDFWEVPGEIPLLCLCTSEELAFKKMCCSGWGGGGGMCRVKGGEWMRGGEMGPEEGWDSELEREEMEKQGAGERLHIAFNNIIVARGVYNLVRWRNGRSRIERAVRERERGSHTHTHTHTLPSALQSKIYARSMLNDKDLRSQTLWGIFKKPIGNSWIESTLL